MKTKNGKYDTRTDGKATAGRWHMVKITGTRGGPREGEFHDEAVLFAEYATTVDLPTNDASQNYDVPPIDVPRVKRQHGGPPRSG